MENTLMDLALDTFCYLTTIGRRSGREHTIEIWFAINDTTLYMLAGGREKSDWVKNLRNNPEVRIKIRNEVFSGQARDVHDSKEDTLARHIVYAKYAPIENDLEDWAATALPIAVDLPA